MIELGQLEKAHAEFEKRKTRIVVISLEDQETAKATQADFPHLIVVADEKRGLSDALDVVHRHSGPGGVDTAAPTTFLVDGAGMVRWMFRPERFLVRLTAAELLAAVDERIGVEH
jgi:peroxiredoxin